MFSTIIFSISTATLEAATVGYSWDSSSVNEAVPVWDLKVELSSAQANDVSVDYTITGGNAYGNGVDFTLNPDTLIIPAGTTSANVTMSIIDDNLDELQETIKVTLSNPQNATLGATTTHTLTIEDNESFPRTKHIRGVRTDQMWTVYAARFSTIVTLFSPHAGGNDISSENNRVEWIKSLNPNNKVLIYVSGLNLSNAKKEWGNNIQFQNWHPELLLKDDKGAFVKSRGYGGAVNPDIGNSVWQDMMASWSKELIDTYGYDGIFIDLVQSKIGSQFGGQPDIFNEWPVNPRTGELYTNSDWKQDQLVFLEKIRNKIGTEKFITINGVYTGSNYFNYSYPDHFPYVGNMHVEAFAWKSWITNSWDNYWPESQWKQNVDMLVDVTTQYPLILTSVKFPKLPDQQPGDDDDWYQQKVKETATITSSSSYLWVCWIKFLQNPEIF